MHPAVANGVTRVGVFESRLPHRTITISIRNDEKRYGVGGALLGCDRDLRIYSRARSTGRRLCMAAAATVQIEARSEPGFGPGYRALNRLDFDKSIQPRIKKLALFNRQTCNRGPCACRACADSRVVWQ